MQVERIIADLKLRQMLRVESMSKKTVQPCCMQVALKIALVVKCHIPILFDLITKEYHLLASTNNQIFQHILLKMLNYRKLQ